MAKDVDLEFVCRALSIFNGFDALSNEDVWWRTDDEYAPITLMVNCNDLFFWGCSDCEEITRENLPMLETTFAELKAMNKKDGEFYKETHLERCTPEVFCCRARKMRPQGACYDEKYYPKAIWPLFDSAGPERETGMGNPAARPAAA